jgi:hypothetical protein
MICKKKQQGSILVFSIIMVFIAMGVSSTLISFTTAGANRVLGGEFKFKSKEIAEAAIGLSLNALRQATDGFDNDGDGTIDEGVEVANIFQPSVVAKIEGNLGRIGTVSWTMSNDANGNGLPDFGESNVDPINMSGGETFSYTIFSENDGLDNDSDGTTDEEDEAGFMYILTQGRYESYDTTMRYSGKFSEKWTPPPPPNWCPNTAFACGGDMTVLGNCNVLGTEGNIHSNGFLDLGGSSSIIGDATASEGGNIDPANVGGVVDTSVTKLFIPDITKANVLGLRDQAASAGKDVYYLNPDGSIVKNGTTLSGGGAYHGWEQQAGGEWKLNGNQADLDGLFYSEKDVYIGGGKQNLSMTVVSEGNVAFNGNGKYTSYYDNFFLVSLKDIKLSGTPQESGDLGAVMAREQIMAEGTTFIRGTVMAADMAHDSIFVTSTTVSGTFDVEYNGGFSTNFPMFDPNSKRYKFDPDFAAYEEQ